MQIPQNIINMLSAKGKGYVEAALKIAEGQRLMHEGTHEIAALDGKKKIAKGGGIDVLSGVRDLAKRPVTLDNMKALLKKGPLNTKGIASQFGCSGERVRVALSAAKGVHLIGTGNKVQWSLTPDRSSIAKRPKVANRTLRTKPPHPKKGRKQTGKTAKMNMNLKRPNLKAEEANKVLVIKALTAKPGQTIGPLMKSAKRSFYPLTRAIEALLKDGRLEKVAIKDHNGRPQSTWKVV